MHPYRVFTLNDANRAVREVDAATRPVRERLEKIRAALTDAAPELTEELEEETREILDRWQKTVYKLGAEPKGIFTVDFRSPDPNVLWCWTVDESEITHLHLSWESFKDRVPISVEGGWPGAN